MSNNKGLTNKQLAKLAKVVDMPVSELLLIDATSDFCFLCGCQLHHAGSDLGGDFMCKRDIAWLDSEIALDEFAYSLASAR